MSDKFFNTKIKNQNNRAFTLIELLVVVAIIGILSSVVLASLNSVREKARIASGLQFASMLDRTLGVEGVANFSFDEGSGINPKDGSTTNNIADILLGATYSTDSPSGKGYSLSFDGVNDYVRVTNGNNQNFIYDGTTGLTVSAWIKKNQAEDFGNIISKPINGGGKYNYKFETNNSGFYLNGNGYSVSFSKSLSSDKWYHVAISVNKDKKASLYIDGKLEGVGSISSVDMSTANDFLPLAIGTLYPYEGAWTGNINFSFHGLIDEPRVFMAGIGD